MNRQEQVAVQAMLDAVEGVYHPTGLQSQLNHWNALGHALRAVTALLAEPVTSSTDAQFSTEYQLQCWSDSGQDWYTGCGWQTTDPEDTGSMLRWYPEQKCRVVRVDTVTSTIVLGERDAEPDA